MLVVQILVAFVALALTLFLVGRWAWRRTTEDRAQQHRVHAMKRRRPARTRAGRTPQPEPIGPTRRPIQVVAADLRRLSRQLALVPSGSTLVRWKALWAAYDGVLVEAAEMLEVPHELADQPAVGVARDVERVRMLAALEGAGMVVRG